MNESELKRWVKSQNRNRFFAPSGFSKQEVIDIIEGAVDQENALIRQKNRRRHEQHLKNMARFGNKPRNRKVRTGKVARQVRQGFKLADKLTNTIKVRPSDSKEMKYIFKLSGEEGSCVYPFTREIATDVNQNIRDAANCHMSFEEIFAQTIGHEMIHQILFDWFGYIVSGQFDNICFHKYKNFKYWIGGVGGSKDR